ncbi:MAG: hypothetical protein V4547_09360 [Bacteroidota bacterium]
MEDRSSRIIYFADRPIEKSGKAKPLQKCKGFFVGITCQIYDGMIYRWVFAFIFLYPDRITNGI